MIMKSLAWHQYLTGHKLDSIQEFEEIIGRTPSSRMRSCVHAALGRIYLELNKVDEALYHHRECIKERKRSQAQGSDPGMKIMVLQILIPIGIIRHRHLS